MNKLFLLLFLSSFSAFSQANLTSDAAQIHNTIKTEAYAHLQTNSNLLPSIRSEKPSTEHQPSQGQKNLADKMKFLIHITCGPENPTKAALGFLVAKTALAEGHSVSLFLAGDAVTLLQNAQLDKVEGLGTGKLREHFDALIKGGAKFYLSGMSSKARGVTEADLQGKSAEFAMPTKLVQLAAESDRMFTY